MHISNNLQIYEVELIFYRTTARVILKLRQQGHLSKRFIFGNL